MKTKAKAVLPVILIILVSIAAEFVFSNFVYFSYVRGNDEVCDYQSEYVTQAEITENNSNFSITFFEFPVYSVKFTVSAVDENARPCYANALVYISDENNTNNASLVNKEKIYIDNQERSYTAYIHSYGDATYLDVTFNEYVADFTVKDIVINPSYEFSFDFLRLAAVFALLLFAYIAKKSKGFALLREELGYGGAKFIAIAVCVTVSLCILIFDAAKEQGLIYAYPLEYGVEKYSPYIQQLDAFVKGQLHLDVKPSEELLALENPYNFGERGEAKYLFDRAFFNGKYYSYFGIAPLLVFYIPFFLVSGFVPTDIFALGIFAVLTAVFMPLAVFEWAKRRKNVMPWFAAVVSAAAFFAAMVPLIQRGRASFYYVASLAAIAFISAFVFWVLKALNSDKNGIKTLYFAFAGVSFALTFLSRINSVLPFALPVAAFVIMYAVKYVKAKKIRKFITHAAALGLPVAAAIIFSFIYNYLRFGNPLQFGATYQLTVADTSNYEIFAGGFIPAMYHYFIQPFRFSEYFPFVQIEIVRFADYGRTIYIDDSFGVFAIPFMLPLLLSPAIFKSKRAAFSEKILLGAVLVSTVVTAFVDFCLGGVIFRYTADILPAAALTSAFILIGIFGNLPEICGKPMAVMLKKAAVVLCVVSIICCLAVSVSVNKNLSIYAPEVYYFAKDFFTVRS